MRFTFNLPLLCASIITVMVLAFPRVGHTEQLQWQQWSDGTRMHWIWWDGSRWVYDDVRSPQNPQGQQPQQPQGQAQGGTAQYEKLGSSGLLWKDPSTGGMCAWLKGKDGEKHCYPVVSDNGMVKLQYKSKRTGRLINRKVNNDVERAVRRFYSDNAQEISEEYPEMWENSIADFVNPPVNRASEFGLEKETDDLYKKDGSLFVKDGNRLRAIQREPEGDFDKFTLASIDTEGREGRNAMNLDQLNKVAQYYENDKNRKNSDGVVVGWGALAATDEKRIKIEKTVASLNNAIRMAGGTPPSGPSTTGVAGNFSRPGVKTTEPLFCSNPMKAVCNASRTGRGSDDMIDSASVETTEKNCEFIKDSIRKKIVSTIAAAHNLAALPPPAPVTPAPADDDALWRRMFGDTGAPKSEAEKVTNFFRELYSVQKQIGECNEAKRNNPGSTACTEAQMNDWSAVAVELYKAYVEAMGKKIATNGSAAITTQKLAVQSAISNLAPASYAQALKDAVEQTKPKDVQQTLEVTLGLSVPGVTPLSPMSNATIMEKISQIVAYCGPDLLTASGYLEKDVVANVNYAGLCPGAMLESDPKGSDITQGTVIGAGSTPDQINGDPESLAGASAYLLGRSAERALSPATRTMLAGCLKEKYVDSGVLPKLMENVDNHSVGISFMLKSIIPQMITAQMAANKLKPPSGITDPQTKLQFLGKMYSNLCQDWKPGGGTLDPVTTVSTNPYNGGQFKRANFAHGERNDVFATEGERVQDDGATHRGESRELNREALFKIAVGLNKDLREQFGCVHDNPETTAPELKPWPAVNGDLMICKLN